MRGKKNERLIKLNKRSILIEYPVYSTIIVFFYSVCFLKLKDLTLIEIIIDV